MLNVSLRKWPPAKPHFNANKSSKHAHIPSDARLPRQLKMFLHLCAFLWMPQQYKNVVQYCGHKAKGIYSTFYC